MRFGSSCKGQLQAVVVAAVVEGLDAAGDFEGAGETGDDVAISLAVEFDLAGFVLHELGLVAALDGAEFVGAAAERRTPAKARGSRPTRSRTPRTI